MKSRVPTQFNKFLILTFFMLATLAAVQVPETNGPTQPEPSAPDTAAEVETRTQAESMAPKVLVIRVSDEDNKYMVDQVQADFILKSLDEAEGKGYDRIILKIDTYGGVVFAAREITERLLRSKIPTTAYVETKAISAGTFIAWACDEIVMETLTTMGDAQMIYQTTEGIEEAPEKMVTVFRSDWEKSSDAKNRSFALARGFFEKDVVVLQVGAEDNWEFILKSDYDTWDEKEKQAKPIMQTIVEEGKLLTLHADKAARLGIVTVAKSFDDYLATNNIPASSVYEVNMNMNQSILRFLGAKPWIFFILTLIGLNGIYAELKAPGFGIPGLTAIVCFTIIFGSRYLLGTANTLEILLFVLGIALCFAEIFIIPGFGVVGLSGLLLMFGSLIMASFPDFGEFPTHELQFDWLKALSLTTFFSFTLSVATMVIVFPVLFKSPIAQRHMLPNEMRPEDGYVMKTVENEEALIGKTGTTPGGLRPSGKMKLDDGRYLDVVSTGHFVDPGSRVTIYKVDGNRIVVRPA